jgi:hypothetical protein
MTDDPAIFKLFDGFGPFVTFDQKISTAYAFRLIPVWVRNDLSTIKDIRNHYAHSPKPIHVDDPRAHLLIQSCPRRLILHLRPQVAARRRIAS